MTAARLSSSAPVPEPYRSAVVALGNFDGFHLGHQAVVGRAVQRAAHERRPVMVATFEPHPVRLFRPDTTPFRLTSLDQRQELFGHAGADAMLVFEFDSTLASTSAEDFVALLADRIGAAAIVTGDDFTFGKGRGGNVEVLAELARRHGMASEAVRPVLAGAARVSSGRIREALEAGDPGEATRLLTRPFAVRAIVERGDQRGRTLGYPTANMRLGEYQRPRYGVYAATARLPGGRELPAVANLGTRPMFDPPVELLETHLFDFDGDLYGEEIEVALRHYLRREEKFDGIDALKAQMDRDAHEARGLLAAAPVSP